MDKVTLGSTGLAVTRLGFGCIPITRLAEREAADLVAAAIDAGINFFDTAWSYPGSEERIGLALRGRDRSRLVLATKDGSADGAMFTRHVEESLRRLGTDYLDLVQLHNVGDRKKWEAVSAPGAACEAALELRRRGLVRHVGVTTHDVRLAAELVEGGLFETVQAPLNFVATEAEGLLPLCRRKGLGFIGMKPFAGGMLEDARLALGYLQQFPEVVPIPGLETAAELRQVVELYESPRPLTAEELARIEALRSELGKVFCHACGYCQPCPQGIGIAMVLRAPTFARRMSREYAARVLRPHMARVAECRECGECMERCPYHLAIPEMLREKRDWYDGWVAEGP